MAIGIVIYLACIALAVLIFVVRLLWWFATFFVPQFIAALREGWARREKTLAWMERHWATRWCAPLNRRLIG